MVEVDNIWKSFSSNHVLKGVSLTLKPGELVGVVGPSGAGKSVLLKILGGVLPADFGEVRANYSTGGEDKAEMSTEVGFLFQEGALFDSMTVLENVAYPLQISKSTLGYKEGLERAYRILSQVGLKRAYKKMPGQLSGGMRRRVGIARALVSEPSLVLLDDPTGGLDPVAASTILDLIKTLHARTRPTMVLVSHDIRRLLPRVDRVIALFGGRVSCDLPPSLLEGQAPDYVVRFLQTRFDFSLFSRGGEDRSSFDRIGRGHIE